MSTETNAPKVRTITLTDAPPVRIREDLWPVIASARGDSYDDNDYARHSQAKAQGELDEYFLTVRQHADGRAIVYARLDGSSAWTRTENRAEGVRLDAGADLAAAVRRVGERCQLPDRIIRDCIGDLPAVDLDEPAPIKHVLTGVTITAAVGSS